MSTFADLITSKQDELKEDLRLIFIDISTAMQASQQTFVQA